MLAGLLLLVSISTSGAQIDYAQLFGLGNGFPVFGPDPRAPDPSAFYRSQDTSSVGKAVARGLPININSVIHNVKSAPASAHLELWDQASPSPTAAPAPQPAPVPQLFPVRRQRHWPRYDHYGGDPYYHPYFDEGGYESYEPPPRRPPRPRPRRPGRPSTSRYTRPEDVASVSETGREPAKHKVDKGEGTNLNMVGGGNTEADKNEGTKTGDSGDVKGDLKKLSGDLGNTDHSTDKKKKPTDEGTKENDKKEDKEEKESKKKKEKEDDSSEGKKKKSKTKQKKQEEEEDHNEKETEDDEEDKEDKEKGSGLKKGEVPLDQAGVHGLADKSKTSKKKGGKKEKGKKKGGDEEEGEGEDENGPLEVVDGEVKVPQTVDGDTEGGEEEEDEEGKGKKMKKKGGKKGKKGKKKGKKKKKDEDEEEDEGENEEDEEEDGEEEYDEGKEKGGEEEDQGEEDGGEDDECPPMSSSGGMTQNDAKPHAPSTTTPAGDDYSDFESSDCEEEDEKEEVETKKKKKGGKNKKQKKGKKGKQEKKKKGGESKKGKKSKCPMKKKPKCGGKKNDDNERHEEFGESNHLNPNPSPAFMPLNQYPVSQSSGSYPVAPGYGRQYDAPKRLKGRSDPLVESTSGNSTSSSAPSPGANCAGEKDEFPLKCGAWRDAGYCETNQATQYLWCRKTCLCGETKRRKRGSGWLWRLLS